MGAYRCAYINVESAQTAREDVGRAMGAIATEIAHEAQDTLNDPETAGAARGLDTTDRPDVAVLPRELTRVLQQAMPEQRTAWYVDAEGGLDMDKRLAAFQDFFRQNSEHWVERAQYMEAGPQLVLQAFLHRVVNGRGRIEREYALGSRRVDLRVIRPGGPGRAGRFVVECKLLRDGGSYARTVERGLEQTAAYMDLSNAAAGHLVVFDMRAGRTWAEKSYRDERQRNGTAITVWGT